MYHYAVGNVTHGPVPIESLRGKITPQTLVWSEGMTDWRMAAEVEDLRSILSPGDTPSECVSPPIEPSLSSMQPVARSSNAPAPVVVQYATSNVAATPPGLAVASLITGIVCVPMICAWPLSLVCAVLAIVFGFIARSQCAREQRPGGGMALAGIILGCVPLVIVLIFVLILIAAALSAAAGA